MPCRIGITTDPDRRKREWKQQHSTLYNWQILQTAQSKSEAQSWENTFARMHGCDSSEGGSGHEKTT